MESSPPARGALRWFELALVVALVAASAAIAMPAVERAYDAQARQLCQGNLKQIGFAVTMYSNESHGERLPPVSATPGNWIVDATVIAPEFLTDLDTLICPAHPDAERVRFRPPGEEAPDPACVTGHFYTYLGFAVADDFDAITAHDFLESGDWLRLRHRDISDSVSGVSLPYALNLLGGTSGSGILMWDRIGSDAGDHAHTPLGVHVLFLDGSVRWQAYDPEAVPVFPVTRAAADLFEPISQSHLPNCY